LVSHETTAELDEVLRRPKFERYVSEQRRLEFLAALLREAEVVEVVDMVTDCRDPKDNKFLELASSDLTSGVSWTGTGVYCTPPWARRRSLSAPASII
jgi:putative PIN family toxin of toxin-antitoxin system